MSTMPIVSKRLHEIGKNWYNYLVDNGVEFKWETKVTDINFYKQLVFCNKNFARCIIYIMKR